jgi:Na+-transporting methylmalonyl-CoA/oxaloacetate decarboxylase beta subunit
MTATTLTPFPFFKIAPSVLIGTTEISAYPKSSKGIQEEGQKYNAKNYLLMHAMGTKTDG